MKIYSDLRSRIACLLHTFVIAILWAIVLVVFCADCFLFPTCLFTRKCYLSLLSYFSFSVQYRLRFIQALTEIKRARKQHDVCGPVVKWRNRIMTFTHHWSQDATTGTHHYTRTAVSCQQPSAEKKNGDSKIRTRTGRIYSVDYVGCLPASGRLASLPALSLADRCFCFLILFTWCCYCKRSTHQRHLAHQSIVHRLRPSVTLSILRLL